MLRNAFAWKIQLEKQLSFMNAASAAVPRVQASDCHYANNGNCMYWQNDVPYENNRILQQM